MQRLPLFQASLAHEGVVHALRLRMPPRGLDAVSQVGCFDGSDQTWFFGTGKAFCGRLRTSLHHVVVRLSEF
jgi:hypothetical protein